jgi:hypothetical protein
MGETQICVPYFAFYDTQTNLRVMRGSQSSGRKNDVTAYMACAKICFSQREKTKSGVLYQLAVHFF